MVVTSYSHNPFANQFNRQVRLRSWNCPSSIPEDDHLNAMAQCLLLDSEKDLLGTLKVGQATVKLQGRIARPFQIAIPEFIIRKGKIADNCIRERMRHIAPSFPQEGSGISSRTNFADPKEPEPKAESLEDAGITFLKDVQKYPDSGIAARYKRLGLSVRQGQKLKAKLVQEELIEEQGQFTLTGRLIKVSLTAQGNEVVSQAGFRRHVWF